MARMSQTRDDNICDQPSCEVPSAWKTLAAKITGRFPTAMSQLLRGRGQLRRASVLQLQARQFRGVLGALACGRTYCWTIAQGPDRGRIWLGLDSCASAAMIDIILGGRPYQSQSAPRTLTAIDRRLLGRILDRAAGMVAGLAGIPQPMTPLNESKTSQPPIVWAVCLDLELGGSMWLFADVELHADQKSGSAGDKSGAKGGPIELSATLNVAEIESDQLAGLEIGDVIATDVSVGGEVVVRLAGIPKYVGQLSTVDGKKAITITRKIIDQD